MIKLINSHTGTEMWVSEDRINEYLAAGHKLAASHAEESIEEPKTAKKSKTKK